MPDPTKPFFSFIAIPKEERVYAFLTVIIFALFGVIYFLAAIHIDRDNETLEKLEKAENKIDVLTKAETERLINLNKELDAKDNFLDSLIRAQKHKK